MATITDTPRLTATGTVPMTADELYRLGKEEGRGELIRGVFCPKMPTNRAHARTMSKLARFLEAFVDETQAGELQTGDPGIHLERDLDTVRAPDLAFFVAGRLPPLVDNDRGFQDVVPDLAIEIASPSQSATEVYDKAQMWLYHGVRMVWNVWPSTKTIEVFTPDDPRVILGESDTLTGGDVLPRFTTPIAALFEE